MRASISSCLVLSNLTTEEKNTITKILSLKNPAYQVMVRHKNYKALYRIKEYIKYYQKISDTSLATGRGALDKVLEYFKIDKVSINVSTAECKKRLRAHNLVLRDYQIGVSEEILKKEHGIIRLDTAFGKTIIAGKLVEMTNLKTLIIVHRGSLLIQFVEHFRNFYKIDPGIINRNIFKIKDVTIATIQTLKKRDLSGLSKEFGMIIYDECHTAPTPKNIKVILSFAPLRLYGMTGTADRSDGQGEAIKFLFGNIIVDRTLPAHKPTVKIVEFNDEFFGSDYAEIISDQCDNIKRNKLIASHASSEIPGRKVLILTKRVKHYEAIYNLLPSKIRAYKINSKTGATERKIQNNLLARLREGSTDFDVILGTFSLLSTGVNIPALDTLIIAGDLKSEVLSTQSIGRILRLFEGKKNPKIIDIDDAASGILHNQARQRRKLYKKNNWEIL